MSQQVNHQFSSVGMAELKSSLTQLSSLPRTWRTLALSFGIFHDLWLLHWLGQRGESNSSEESSIVNSSLEVVANLLRVRVNSESKAKKQKLEGGRSLQQEVMRMVLEAVESALQEEALSGGEEGQNQANTEEVRLMVALGLRLARLACLGCLRRPEILKELIGANEKLGSLMAGKIAAEEEEGKKKAEEGMMVSFGEFSLAPVKGRDLTRLLSSHHYILGISKRFLGVASALDETRLAIEIDENNLLAWELAGHLQYEGGRIASALRCFEKCCALISENVVVAHQPTTSHESRIKTMVGCCHFLQGKSEEAIADFKQALELDFENIPAMFNTALQYHQTGKMEPFILLLECCRGAIEERGSRVEEEGGLITSPGSWHRGSRHAVGAIQVEGLLMTHLLEKKKWRRALDIATAIVDGVTGSKEPVKGPWNVVTICQDGAFAALQEGNLARCRDMCDKVLALDDRNLACLCYKGESFFRQGLFSEAAECLDALLAQIDVAELAQSEEQIKKGEYVAGPVHLKEKRELAVRAYNNKAVILASNSKQQEALRTLKTALLISPKSLEAHFNYTIISFKMGQKDHAASAWLEFLGIPTGLNAAYYKIELASFKSGKRRPYPGGTAPAMAPTVPEQHLVHLTTRMLEFAEQRPK